ncbi:glycosyltransferase family 2 protein [Paludibacter sp.]
MQKIYSDNSLKISIITVSYNSASTIRDTFESVLAQTYKNIDYIVVDGNSSDDTIKIIKEYEPKFNGRMRWLSEPDEGLYDAMNKGISMASGDIVGILNSDDFYPENDILNKVSEVFLSNTEIRAVYGDVRFVSYDDTDRIVRYIRAKNFKPFRFRFGFMPPHPSFFTYKALYEQYGLYFTDYKIGADYELLCRFLFKNKVKSQYIPLEIVRMRMGGRSTSSVKSNYILNKEIVRACRTNGIYTNMLILSFKYLIKIFEFIIKK